MLDFEQELKQEVALIDQELEMIMDRVEEDDISPRLTEAMRYSLFAGGKRVRPFLTVQTAILVGGEVRKARRIGAAIELIHTYSLIHDDLPSMDDDDYRRGRPASHKVYGEAMAILAGDALLTLAFRVLGDIELPGKNIGKIINIIGRGAGYRGMVGGQVLDLIGSDGDINLSRLKKIHRAKTGELIRSSVLAGASCGNPGSEQFQALEQYADNLGLCFQIVDDILDVVGDPELMGKEPGSDQKQSKNTYPGILGLEKAREEARKAADRADRALLTFGNKAGVLKELVNYVVNRNK